MKYLEKYRGKKVLVTGHTGFKGSWLSLWLKELGADVTGFALKPDTRPNLFTELNLASQINSIIGDIRDQDHLHAVIRDSQPEYLFHLAAQPLVQRSYNEPRLTYETNIMGTVNLLESIRHVNSVRSCIIVTTDKCYENKEWEHGYKETDHLGGYDPYSSSKACVELITSAYRRSFFNPKKHGSDHTTSISSARAGNVIGGGDWNKNRILTDCALGLSQGKSIQIRNPVATRPWQYILEPLSGYLLLALQAHEFPKLAGAWNFGPSDESVIVVEDLVKLVIKHWGSGRYEIRDKESAHEAGLLKLDSGKARTQLGWKPTYDVEEVVKRTIKWYKAYYEGLRGHALLDLTIQEIKDFSNGDTL